MKKLLIGKRMQIWFNDMNKVQFRKAKVLDISDGLILIKEDNKNEEILSISNLIRGEVL